jgi:hypothetical protein
VTVLPATHAPAAQHPVGHDVPSQTQVLATQRWPGEQASAVPQRQVPVAEQLSDRASHVTQVAPAFPQVATPRLAQVAPAQQPLGHEVASQMQRPPTQRWPPAQALPAPQEQTPAALQPSALVTSHATQAPPLTPQVPSAVMLQVVPAQQPFEQEVASHTQAPAWQRCPLWQAASLPQRQAPASEQVSAVVGSQLTHIAAAVPHAETERG